jgi:hypothetical protein
VKDEDDEAVEFASGDVPLTIRVPVKQLRAPR